MKKIYLLFGICFFCLLHVQAQDVEWVLTGDNTGNAYVVDFFVDDSDTLYALGQFENTLTIGSEVLVSEGGLDMYAVKLDPDRNVVWAFSIGSTGTEIPDEIIARPDGSFVISGIYQNTVNVGGLTMTSDGSYDAFIMDFAADGTPLSVIENKGTDLVGLAGTGIASNGDYVLSGIFRGDAVFNGDQTLTSTGNGFDTYLARYQPDGTLVYLEQISGAENVTPGAGLVLDANDNVYIGGEFRSNLIVDGNTILNGNNPGSAAASRDIWTAKYSADGTFQWARKGGGGFEDLPYHIAIDADANVYSVGMILGPSAFDTVSIAGTQGIDSYIAKYNTDGGILWVKRTTANQPSNDRARGVEVDTATNTLYVSGRFSGGVMWDEFSLNHQAADEADIYLAAFDLDGTTLSASQYSGAGFQQSTIVDVGSPGIVYMGAEFRGTLSIEGISYPSTESTTTDALIAKLRDCDQYPLNVSIEADKEGICSNDQVTFTAILENAGTSPLLQWRINGEVVQEGGTQLIVDTLTSQAEVSLRVSRESYCAEILTSSPVVIDVDNFEITAQISSDQTTPLCEGSIVNFTSEIRGGGDSPSYQWKVNNVDVDGATEPTFSTDQLMAGDIVTLDIVSSLACVDNPNASSNAIFPDILPLLGVTINPAEPVTCSSSDIMLTATLNGEYTNVAYEWLLNGVTITDETSPTLQIANPVNGDEYEVQVTAEDVCYESEASVASASVVLTVSDAITPSITIAADKTTIDEGEEVTFTATTENAGEGATIEWFIGTENTNVTGETFVTSNLSDQDVVTAVLTTTLECSTASEATSNEVTITVNTPTGIDREDINDETRFYPNPMVNISVLEFPNDQGEVFEFIMTDLSGKAVLTIKNIRGNTVEIEKGQLESGIYLYRLTSESRISSGKVAIQ